MCVLVCVLLCTMRIVMCDFLEAMHACACSVGFCAMHVRSCLCVLMHEAHGHCDCCKAMHGCCCLFGLVHKAHGH